ncbi:MAG: transposase [Minicystis sp.]
MADLPLLMERGMSGEIIEGSEGDTSGHMTGHMTGRMTGRMIVIARVSGRRRWTVEQKLLMLRDAFGSGGCVSTAMERHEVSSGQLYTWRRQAMSGELTGFSPPVLMAPVAQASVDFAEVAIIASQPSALILPQPAPADPATADPATVGMVGRIGIELASGIRLTVDTSVDTDALARVLSVIGR